MVPRLPDPPRTGAVASRLTRFDPTCVDLTEFDVVRGLHDLMASSDAFTARATELAKDVTYITVGLGLLSYQRAQVRRREFERALRPRQLP